MWGGAIAWMFFFFNDTATTEIYTLSLHDALPICANSRIFPCSTRMVVSGPHSPMADRSISQVRSEEHTSELQSQSNLVCRLLLEKKRVATPGRHCPQPPRATAFQPCARHCSS